MESSSGIVMAMAAPTLFGLSALLRVCRHWQGFHLIRVSAVCPRRLAATHQVVSNTPSTPDSGLASIAIHAAS